MKKLVLLSVILVIAIFSNAQTSDKKWGIGVGVGGYGTLEKGGTGFMPELYFSRYLSPKFDVLLRGNLGLFRSNLLADLDLANPTLNLRYKLGDESKKFRPYLMAGPGFLADNSETGLNFNAGIGAKYYFKPATALYFDAGYINGIEVTKGATTIRENLWKATVGIEFDLGKTKDSDMDGVSDNKDKCPNTPDGVAVDKDGCPLDSDGDGVADYIDDCPTVAGLTSLKGCPDKDKDGIADKDDACPDEAGLPALKGCPDADGDGIADKDDKCANTPKGWKVDSNGCPIDTDKDGLFDAEDDCPTVAGPKDNKGCPKKEPEVKKEITRDQIDILNIQVTPIHFVSDKSYITDYSKGILEKLINILNENKEYRVNIFGHADSQGSDEHNMKLSQDRILSTIQYLESKGISSGRIIHQKAFGETKPKAPNNTPEGRLQNRRVEFELFKMK